MLADPEKDQYYKFFATDRTDLFWMQFEQSRDPGFFTPEFKDLITNMLQMKPARRLTMSDIWSHPWMLGETATHEAVWNEFTLR
jgi:serine/threonine protein kinase